MSNPEGAHDDFQTEESKVFAWWYKFVAVDTQLLQKLADPSLKNLHRLTPESQH